MTIKEIIQKLHTTMTDASGQESHFESWLTLNDGIIDAIDALKALDNQEPVAWMDKDGDVLSASVVSGKGLRNIPLYTTPPQRTWVGLTDEEINKLWAESHEDGIAMQQGFTTQQHYFAHLILRKAQEK